MRPEFVRRMSSPVPRYTSYPTAASFRSNIGAVEFAESLAQLSASTALSLYVHIPFCSKLCWYCGCNAKVANNREAITQYLEALEVEMTMVAALRTGWQPVSHIHWGGGSPNILAPSEIIELTDTLRRLFTISPAAEFAVEVDPRTFTAEQAGAFAAAGVTRVSVGVQDFEPTVQKAINREQSFETTRACIDLVRAAGIRGINIDLVYGLPHQTRPGLEQTVKQVLRLDPDRIALFGYAHLPSRIKHQALIDQAALPDAVERFGQSQRARRLLIAAGYVPVGLDHFAKPDDPLAAGPVRRNFQGYTTDTADALVGFGSSAISMLPNGYFQNAVAVREYLKRVSDFGLATARGWLLTDEDRVRAFVINRLMCDYEFSATAVRRAFGPLAADVINEADILLQSDQEGLVEKTPDGFRLTARGKPFVRAVAACFDTQTDHTAKAGSCGV